MPTRQLRDEPHPTLPPPDPGQPPASAREARNTQDTRDTVDAPGPRAASREPVLLGEVLFHTLAELARRTPEPVPGLPAQRTRPHP
ncbi:hypothetical protein AB0O91_24940 [Kitasatospora sp. NPDC089797]|uniref:hypothetical protein n=1 Tax=Kitasatospora sp. NPDC089797 TaxID=3155298 RepID=UPI00341D07A5